MGEKVEQASLLKTALPKGMHSLADLLLSRGSDTHIGFSFIGREGQSTDVSFAELAQTAKCAAGSLQQSGLKPGKPILLQLDDCQQVVTAFWACVLAGMVPVCLNPAPSYSSPNNQLDKCNGIVQDFELSAILTSNALAVGVGSLVALKQQSSVRLLTIEAICTEGASYQQPKLVATDTAAMFLTSGSTGTPKGVPQSHQTMLSMAAGTAIMNGFSGHDVSLNWMSMDHAGALVFLGITPLLVGARQVHAPIDYILKDPLRWLELINRHRATISWAPNFVFSLMLSKRAAIEAGDWDLSSMKFMVNAGEAVVASTARQFIALMQTRGLPEGALRPAFGMVETCSGITWSEGFRLNDTADDDPFVSLGKPIPGASVSIVDEQGNLVIDGVEGRLRVRGDSVFGGYFKRDALNAEVIRDGWFETGDLAFLENGELFVTGRSKDVLIVNGTNYYSHDIESVAAEIAILKPECVAALGVPSGKGDTEQLLLAYACHELCEGQDRSVLERELAGKIFAQCGITCAGFLLLHENDFPRTAIGKIQRSELRNRYLEGEFEAQVTGMLGATEEHSSEPSSNAMIGGRDLTELMESIKQIWCRHLGVVSLSVDDIFFEVGGSSLTAIQIQADLESLIGRAISMAELFDTPTIRSMAEHFGGFAGEQHRQRSPKRSDLGHADIAVIGIGCRFPGAHGPNAFWQVLEAGTETITRFDAEQAIAAGLSEAAARHPNQVNAAPILEDVEGCDLDFWRFSQREATVIDPQQRVFLETAWEAFEDAGYCPGAHLGRVGVYASAATNTYQQNNLYANRHWVAQNGGAMLTVDSYDGFNVMTSNDKDYLPTRVSYKLDLVGPSLSVQTACSSTLVAVHEAVKSLRLGESDMAVAGGCALMLPQHAGHLYVEGMINSPDGHCRAYDAQAKGTIFGSGSGAVILKRLDDAIDDGDHIYAVIKGSGVANDGAQKMGYAAPSMAGEARAIEQALRDSGIEPQSIGFVEGHGTGTPIGDPIEVQALTKAFGEPADAENHCALGSVKTNIGHMGIASGIAGFIKTVLALYHKKLPATVHFQQANPAIVFENTPFYVSAETRPWKSEQPRRAGVNSLGIGGTNVHVILEEAPERVREGSSVTPTPYLLPLSAHSPEALEAVGRRLYTHLRDNPDLDLRDVCYTYQNGRMAQAWRRGIAFRDREELLSALQKFTSTRPSDATDSRLVFMFTGQGAQYLGMAEELIKKSPVFLRELQNVCALFEGARGVSVEQLLIDPQAIESADPLLQQTQYTQIALFCLQVALVQFYMSCGVKPDAVIGHSVGEIVAVWAAGGLSLADAARLVEARSRIMQSVTEAGAMAAVSGSYNEVTTALFGNNVDVELAAVNSDTEFTISGTPEAINRACDLLESEGLRCKSLTVSHAFHSTHFTKIQQQFADEIAGIAFKPLLLPCFRNIDGYDFTLHQHDANYWVEQLCEPVWFRESVSGCLKAGFARFLEIGPQPILCGFGRNNDRDDRAQWLPSLRKGQSDLMQIYGSLADLFESGHRLAWSDMTDFSGQRIGGLPTYPWQRTRCWVSADSGVNTVTDKAGLTNSVINLPGRLRIYAQTLSADANPIIAEHRVFGRPVPPAAFWVSQFLETALHYQNTQSVAITDVHFLSPLSTNKDEEREVHIGYRRHDRGASIELYSLSASGEAGDEQMHVVAELVPPKASSKTVNTQDIVKRSRRTIAPSVIQNHMRGMGLDLGPSYRWLENIWIGESESLAKLRNASDMPGQEAFFLSAGLIDSHWQSLLVAGDMPTQTVVPARIDSVTLFSGVDRNPHWVHAQRRQDANGTIVADVALLNAAGEPILITEGLHLQRISAELFGGAQQATLLLSSSSHPVQIVAEPGPLEVYVGGAQHLVDDLMNSSDALETSGLTLHQAEGSSPESNPAKTLHALRLIDAGDSQDLSNLLYETTAWANGWLSRDPGALTIQVLILTESAKVASDSQGVDASAVASALHALVASLAREHPSVAISSLETESINPDSLMALAGFMARSMPSNEHLCWRDGQWHAKQVSELVLERGEMIFNPARWQVITGGLGGLGLATATWMASLGARRFVLLARSEPSADAERSIDALQKSGAEVVVASADVLDLPRLRQLSEQLHASGDVETVVHAAGVVKDGVASGLSAESFTAVVRAKVEGAINLNRAFSNHQDALIVLYSSTAGWFGAEGQANYAAANAALDGLTQSRGEADLATVSVAWGPWESLGMTARLSDAQRNYITERGYGFLTADDAFLQLSAYLAAVRSENKLAGTVDIPRTVSIASMDPIALQTLFRSSALLDSSADAGSADISEHGALAEAITASGVAAAEAFMQQAISALVVELTSIRTADDVDLDAGLLDMGVDSLAGLELRKRLEGVSQLKLKSTLILDYPSIRGMAHELVKRKATELNVGESSKTLEPKAMQSETDSLLEELAREISGMESK